MISTSNENCPVVEPIYATREQAWAFVAGGSRKIFEAHYRPHVREHKRGGRIFYRYEELRQCAKDIEAGTSPNQTAARESTSSGSRTGAGVTTSQRAQQITQQLKLKPRQSTPRLYPVSGGNPGRARS
jgi:hypothetical protein